MCRSPASRMDSPEQTGPQCDCMVLPMRPSPRRPDRQQLIRSLSNEYIEMYASRDDRLTARFSDNFSGYTGGGDFLVKKRDEWGENTRLDFSQEKSRRPGRSEKN